MADFQSMFIKTKGKPIEYKGMALHMADDFPLSGEKRFCVTRESTNSKWRQGVGLRLRRAASFLVEGRDCGPNISLWEDTAPLSIVIEVTSEVDVIEVKNIWDTGDGVKESWHSGAAMVFEDLQNGRRYRCNDWVEDDDFNDIIFRIEILNS